MLDSRSRQNHTNRFAAREPPPRAVRFWAATLSSRVRTRLGLTGLWPLASHVTAAAVVLFSFPFVESCGADGVPPSEWWRSSGAALTVVLDAGNASTIEELGDANTYAAEGRAPPLRATRAGGVEFAYFADGAQ